MKQQQLLRTLTQSGVIAALYVALTTLLQPIGFGPVQCRFSEMLTILPVYMPAAVPGLTVGCFLSNVIGLSTGANPVGGWDLLLGTAATGIAAVLTRWLRNVTLKDVPLAATLPPVVLNAVIVGTELYVVYGGMSWWLYALSVAAGQSIACIGGGLLLAMAVKKSGLQYRV